MTDLEAEEIPETLAKLLPLSLMARYECVPFDDAGAFVCIAVANALPPEAVKELERACHKHIEVFLAREDLIRKELQALRRRLEIPPRLHIRYEASYPVEYQFCTRQGVLAEQSSHQGTTLNISEGGFLVDGPPVGLGTPEELVRIGLCASIVVAPGTPHESRVLCRMKSLKPQGDRCAISLEILSASAEDRRRLKELCLQAIRAQANRPPVPD
jgi:type II secretory ATPase GspE/PulE/Tfp pilus assembly ATPase PilB-like protein